VTSSDDDRFLTLSDLLANMRWKCSACLHVEACLVMGYVRSIPGVQVGLDAAQVSIGALLLGQANVRGPSDSGFVLSSALMRAPDDC